MEGGGGQGGLPNPPNFIIHTCQGGRNPTPPRPIPKLFVSPPILSILLWDKLGYEATNRDPKIIIQHLGQNLTGQDSIALECVDTTGLGRTGEGRTRCDTKEWGRRDKTGEDSPQHQGQDRTGQYWRRQSPEIHARPRALGPTVGLGAKRKICIFFPTILLG